MPAGTPRTDGTDTIYGGAGSRTAIDDPGDPSTTGHARDADVILGDNGIIYRLVGSDGQLLRFNYDSYGGSLKVIPRAVVTENLCQSGCKSNLNMIGLSKTVSSR